MTEYNEMFSNVDLVTFRPEIAHYECSLCGNCSQVLIIAQIEEVVDQDGNVLEIIPILDIDGEKTFELVVKHEFEAHGIK